MKISKVLPMVLIVAMGISNVALADGHGVTLSGNWNGGVWATQTHYTGKLSSGASSNTSGGSEATTGVNGNGWSFQKSWNVGSGFSGAGGTVNSNGVETWTNGGSFSKGSSFGADNGNLNGFTNNTAGGVATNYSSYAKGSFKSFTSGKDWQSGGFFTGTFKEKTKH